MKSTLSNAIHNIQIGDTLLSNNIWLAPLAGFSNKAMRLQCRRFGAGACFTEMISLEGVVRDDRKTFEYLDITGEDATIIQLFGKDEPKKFYAASKILQSRYAVKILDVNFGCPVRKVVKTGAGSALLKEPSSLYSIVSALKDSGIWVCAKIRLGFNRNNIEETIPHLDRAGADLITLHSRLATQFYNGNADWQQFRFAREMTNTPLFASGDMKTPKDVETVLRESRVDGVMIGRGAIGRPYVFEEILDYFRTGAQKLYDFQTVRDIMLEFASLFIETEQHPYITPIRAALNHFVRGFEHSSIIRRQIALAKTYDELHQILYRDYESQAS